MPLRDGTQPALNAETIQVSMGTTTTTNHHHQQQQQQQQSANDYLSIDNSTNITSLTGSPVNHHTGPFHSASRPAAAIDQPHPQHHTNSNYNNNNTNNNNPVTTLLPSNNSSSSSLSAKLFSIINRDQPTNNTQPVPPSTRAQEVRRQPEDFIFLAEFSQLYGPLVVRVVSSARQSIAHNDLAAAIVPKIFACDYLGIGCNNNLSDSDGSSSTITDPMDTADSELLGRMVEMQIENCLNGTSGGNSNYHCLAMHFSLFDVDSRGMVRRFAVVYCTVDWEKLQVNDGLHLSQAMESAIRRMMRSNCHLFGVELTRHLADLLLTADSRLLPIEHDQSSSIKSLQQDRDRINYSWRMLRNFCSAYRRVFPCNNHKRNGELNSAIGSDGDMVGSDGGDLFRRIIDAELSSSDPSDFVGALQWTYQPKLLPSVHDSQNIDLLLRSAAELFAHPLDLDSSLTELNDLRQRFSRPGLVMISECEERSALQPVYAILAAGCTLVGNFRRSASARLQSSSDNSGKSKVIDFTVGLACQPNIQQQLHSVNQPHTQVPQQHRHVPVAASIPVIFSSSASTLCVPEHNPAIQSTADHIWFSCPQKFGYRCLSRVLLKYSFAKHLIYSLLSGRTLLILASADREISVSNLVETLMVFLIGANPPSCLKWSTGTQLRSSHLTQYRIIGQDRRYCSQSFFDSQRNRPGVVVDILDYDQETFFGDQYRGNYLERLVEQAKLCDDEPTFLALLHLTYSMIAQQAALYFNLILSPDGSFFDRNDPVPVIHANTAASESISSNNSHNSSSIAATVHGHQELSSVRRSRRPSGHSMIFRRRKSLSSLRGLAGDNGKQRGGNQREHNVATFITTDNSPTVTQQTRASPPTTRRTVMDLFGYSDSFVHSTHDSFDPESAPIQSPANENTTISAARRPSVGQQCEEQQGHRPRLLSSPLILFGTTTTEVNQTINENDYVLRDGEDCNDGQWSRYFQHIWTIIGCFGSDQEIVKYFAENVLMADQANRNNDHLSVS